jgi:parallel beta-helix repeat protein
VSKAGLSLRGATGALRGARCLDRALGVDPARDSVVNGAAGSPGFAVTARQVTIAGFTVQGASGANGAGVYVPASGSGVDVAGNLLQRNTMGVYLTNDGSLAARIEGNCVRDDDVAGPAAGNGVYSDAGLEHATISGNVFSGHANAAVILVGKAGTQTGVAVTGNTASRDASFVFANLTDSHVDGNASVGSSGAGIFFGGGSSGVTVAGNVIQQCAFTGINVRYVPGSFDVSSNNTKLSIAGNRVTGCGDGGIRLRDGTAEDLVRGNRVTQNGTGAAADGISLENADSNRVEDNRSDGNGRDGVRSDADSTGNDLLRNTAVGNREHDCHDDSVGAGTAGTANSWTGDVGATENRTGLCGGGSHAEDERGQPDHRRAEHAKLEICHRTGSGKSDRIAVGAAAAKAHVKHGDVVATAAGCPARAGHAGRAAGRRSETTSGSRKAKANTKHGLGRHAGREQHGGKGDR